MYELPPIDDQTLLPLYFISFFISRSLAHRVLTCPALVTLEYHLLQQQILKGYSDPKLLEILLYLLQAQLSLRGSNPLTVQYDASVLRGAFTVKCEGWSCIIQVSS